MKKLKMTPVQNFRIGKAYSDTAAVLREIKLGTLEGQALSDMKTLEEAVQYLEAFILSARVEWVSSQQDAGAPRTKKISTY